MAGTKPVAGIGGSKRKVDKGAENRGDSNALWDLFNLLVPSEEGGTTTNPEPRQALRQPMGQQPPGMMAQPTDSGVGARQGFSDQDVFGQAFGGGPPPMPERNPAFASDQAFWGGPAPAGPGVPAMPGRSPVPAMPMQGQAMQPMQMRPPAPPMPEQNPTFHPSPMLPGAAPTDPIEAMFMRMMAGM